MNAELHCKWPSVPLKYQVMQTAIARLLRPPDRSFFLLGAYSDVRTFRVATSPNCPAETP
jgi:hypothetical protein